METFKYSAFISYVSENRQMANWLHNRLEHIPVRSLTKGLPIDISGLPNSKNTHTLYPVCLDHREFSKNPTIESEIEEKLYLSKYLIVVCSPIAKEKLSPNGINYLNYESMLFKKILAERGIPEEQYGKFIIPLIIEGTPHNSYPKEISLSTSGISINNDKYSILNKIDALIGYKLPFITIKEKAQIRLLARILCVDYDTIWRRKHRELKRTLIVSILFLIMLSFCSLFAWDYNRTKTEYYTDYIDGIFNEVDNVDWVQGIFSLTSNDIKSRYRYYAFEYERTPIGVPHAYRWRIKKVSYVDSYGNTKSFTSDENHTNIFPRMPIQNFEYSIYNGQLNSIRYCNEINETQVICDLTSEGNINLMTTFKTPYCISANIIPCNYQNNVSAIFTKWFHRKSLISSIIIHRTSNYPSEIFFSESGITLAQKIISRNCENICGFYVKRDSIKRVIEAVFLKGKNFDKDKEYTSYYKYDKKGNLEMWNINHIDTVTFHTSSKKWYSAEKPLEYIFYTTDKFGRPIQRRYLNNTKIRECNRKDYQYYENGFIHRSLEYTAQFEYNNNIISWYNIAPKKLFMTDYKYNKKGLVTVITSLNKNGCLIGSNDDNIPAIQVFKYKKDIAPYLVESYDSLGHLRMCYKNDKNSYIEEYYLYNEKEQLSTKSKVKLDKYNKPIEIAFYDKNGNLKDAGYYSTIIHNASIYYYNLLNEPEMTNINYAREVLEYDFNHNVVNMKLYTAQNICCFNANFTYDSFGLENIIDIDFRSKDGQLLTTHHLTREH